MKKSKSEAFEKFHQENPDLYRVLVAQARRWVRATGRHRLGIASLFETARWEVSISTTDPDFKIPNDHKPFYARLIMVQEADLAGLFELRRAEADEWIDEWIRKMIAEGWSDDD